MTTTSKPHARTKTAGYKEALDHLARQSLGMIAANLDPTWIVPPAVVMIATIFERPTDKVLLDLAGYLRRDLIAA